MGYKKSVKDDEECLIKIYEELFYNSFFGLKKF